MDRLAAEGCCYHNAYSCNPVCMAARHNIITGLPARYHGYDTIAVGKMHFQPCRRYNGFTKMELMEEIPRNLEDDEYAKYLKENGFGDVQSIHGVRHLLYMLPQRSLIDEGHHGSSWVAERSIHYLKENAGKRPFFLWSSFIALPPPFDVPDGWADLYRGKDLPPLKESKTPISAAAEGKKCIADYPNETANLLCGNPGAGILAAKEELRLLLTEYEKRYGLEGYVPDETLAVFEESTPNFYRENNPPIFPKKQDTKYLTLEEEVRRAAAKESVVNLEELDVPYFEKRGTLDGNALHCRRGNAGS